MLWNLCKLHFSLLIRTCWPTRNLAVATRTLCLLASIGRHIAMARMSDAWGRVNRVIVSLDKLRQNVYISVLISQWELFEKCISDLPVSSFHYRTFHIGSFANLKLNAPSSKMSWKCLFRILCPCLYVTTQVGTSHRCEIWIETQRWWMADLCLYVDQMQIFRKTSITDIMNLRITLYFARNCTSIWLHSHTSMWFRHSTGISQKSFPDSPMLSVSFLLFQPGCDVRFVFRR